MTDPSDNDAIDPAANRGARGDSAVAMGMSRLERLLRTLDVLMAAPVLLAAVLLKGVRRAGLHRLPLSRSVLRRVGMMPIRKHYYEPMVNASMLRTDLAAERDLPGIDWNVERQLEFLEKCRFTSELTRLEGEGYSGGPEFRFHNKMFEHGDAELFYSLIRLTQPRRLFEVGAGNSTLVALRAIAANRAEDSMYTCRHVCIEPYEVAWLEAVDVELVRRPVEELAPAMFEELEAGDILFIDSSHIIRPQGDVLHEYLNILPRLAEGVIVHVHDIFSPRDYPREWVLDRHRLWNEQYLLEAFLTHNSSWQILAAVNYLHHHHFDALKAACPNLLPQHEPGSFYLVKCG